MVTDDYVLLIDYVEAENEHTYDHLLQLRGVGRKNGLQHVSHDQRFDMSVLSSGQFITNVENYDYAKGTKIETVHRFAEKGSDGQNVRHGNWETGGQNRLYNEPGELHIDVYPLYPAAGRVRIGDYAESWGTDNRIEYNICVDGKTLAADTIRPWLHGSSLIDVALEKPTSLQITCSTDRKPGKAGSAMFAGANVITRDGKSIPLHTLISHDNNRLNHPAAIADYDGGPIKVDGSTYDFAIGLEPADTKQPATITFDLDGIDAVRLVGTIGCDYFTGDEEQLRKTIAFRQKGDRASYITLLEPHEGTPMVESATATPDGTIKVNLRDGRTQTLRITDIFARDTAPSITIREYKGKTLVREETARP